MTCPVCGGKTAVVDTAPDVDSVYRKRKCLECSHKFVTTEIEGDREDRQMLSQLRRNLDADEIKKRRIHRKGEKLGTILKLVAEWADFEVVGEVRLRHKGSREEIAL